MNCFECGRPATMRHHVVPQVLGGTRTVPLCDEHHALVHSRTAMTVSALTRAGLARARARGQKLGAPREIPPEVEARIVTMRAEGKTLRYIAEVLTAEGIKTARGGRWYASTLTRVLERAA